MRAGLDPAGHIATGHVAFGEVVAVVEVEVEVEGMGAPGMHGCAH